MWSKACSGLALSALFAVGVVHWVWFFNFGDMAFTPYDWPKEYQYYTVLRKAVSGDTLPYHVSVTFHNITNRFLGLPETLLSPQVLLLPWLRTGDFILLNTLLLYTVGFLGCLLIKRRYRLTLVPFALLYVLINFNGYITSRLAVGHSMWNGYFLLPWFALYLLQMLEEGPAPGPPAMKLAFVIFAMMLQGSLHMCIWCWMFLFFLVLFQWRYWKQGALIIAFSGGLSLFRLLPAAVAFWGNANPFISGYPSVKDLLDAFAVPRDHRHPWLGAGSSPLGWWEYDIYVGALGLAVLFYFGIWLRFSRAPFLRECKYSQLDGPLALLTLLSMGSLHGYICSLPLPLVNAERVSSRFVIVPVVLLMVLSAIRLQRLLDPWRRTIGTQALLLGVLLLTYLSLARHSEAWCIARMDQDARDDVIDFSIAIISQDDPWYVFVVNASGVASLVVLAAWLAVLQWLRRGGMSPLASTAEGA